jgi:hypothetical protein
MRLPCVVCQSRAVECVGSPKSVLGVVFGHAPALNRVPHAMEPNSRRVEGSAHGAHEGAVFVFQLVLQNCRSTREK